MTVLTLSVPDISCGGCKATIEEAVGEVSGVEDVNVDVEAKTVRVECGGVDASAIEAVVVDAGYTVAETVAG